MSIAEMSVPTAAEAECAAGATVIVLHGVNWRTYEKFLDAVGDYPLRLTFDRGRLEIMAPLRLHERPRRRIGRMIDVLAEELSIPYEDCGSTTFRREDLERGLEPDECYYIANVAAVRGPREIDLRHDPPPDLALEIDATRSSMDRMAIYAALGVPELWRYDGDALHVYLLNSVGVYEPSPTSRSFPFLSIPAFVDFLHQHLNLDQTAFVLAFRQWVRTNILPNYKPSSQGG